MAMYDLPEEDLPIREQGEHHEFVAGPGRLVVSNTAEELFDNGLKYFKWCKENPIIARRPIMTGKRAGQVGEIEYTRPYTIKGLCLHCNIDEEYMADIRGLKDKKNPYYVAVSKLLYIIYVQNMEGAMVDIYNPMFVAKVLNMEKDETPVEYPKVELVGGLPALLENEDEVLKKLDLENPNWISEAD